MHNLRGHRKYFFELKQVQCPESRQHIYEERLNVLTHQFATVASFIGMIVMVAYAWHSPSWLDAFAVGSFAAFLVFQFAGSTRYHDSPTLDHKQFYRKLDHIAILFVIAGTYSPFMLAIHTYKIGWYLFIALWSLVAVGIVLKLFFTGRFQVFSTLMYLAMGWMTLLAVGPIQESVSTAGLYLLLAGGIAYTVGSIFFLANQLPYNHVIWHLFVMTGAGCHYFAVLTLV